MTRLYIFLALALLLTIACGMTAPVPSSDGKIASRDVPQIATSAVTSLPISYEEVGVVIADALNVRPCPEDSEACPPLGHLNKGDAVMGACYQFGADWWLGFDRVDEQPTRWIAVVFDGKRYVRGVCE